MSSNWKNVIIGFSVVAIQLPHLFLVLKELSNYEGLAANLHAGAISIGIELMLIVLTVERKKTAGMLAYGVSGIFILSYYLGSFDLYGVHINSALIAVIGFSLCMPYFIKTLIAEDEGVDMKAAVMRLLDQGKTYQETADILEISKSKVWRLKAA